MGQNRSSRLETKSDGRVGNLFEDSPLDDQHRSGSNGIFKGLKKMDKKILSMLELLDSRRVIDDGVLGRSSPVSIRVLTFQRFIV